MGQGFEKKRKLKSMGLGFWGMNENRKKSIEEKKMNNGVIFSSL